MTMRSFIFHASNPPLYAFAALLLASACASNSGDGSQVLSSAGGQVTSGGASSLGTAGASAPTGGTRSSTAGASTNGGTSSSASDSGKATGGVSTSGGASSSPSSSGKSIGGATATGGASSIGGATGKATGGVSTIGGASSGTSKATGGVSTIGGASSGTSKATGGVSTNGGASSGTSKATGGVSTNGGASSGTSKATGGTTAAGGAGDGGTSSTSTGPVYNPDFVEFSGSDCTVSDPKDVNFSTLPDLFTMSDGTTRMSKKSDWRCQRAYLKKIIEKYIHGAKPGKPDTVTGTVSKTSIAVHVEHGGKKIDFSVSVSGVPASATGPVPIIIGLGAVATMGGTASLADTVKAEGVATGTYDHQGMLSESSRSGLFTTIYGSTSVSSQIGWAWGVSRVIDVLVDEKAAGRNNIIDPTAVGVYGCSRNGKGAFTVGALDERIALGLPQESGTCGVSALRMLGSAPNGPNGKPPESLAGAKTAGPAWFGTAFNSSKLNNMPGDMHSLLAMYAPRGLLVIDNSRIGELCSSCQHAASAAGQKLFEALGVGKNMGYHAGLPKDPQDHCSFNTEQVAPLQRAIRAHLTKKAAPDGKIELQKDGVADLPKWITWTAPTLTDDMTWASPPVTSQ